MRILVNATSLILEGTLDEIIVPLSLELPDGRILPAGEERISDKEATALAQADARRLPGESMKAYEARVIRLVTWSQEHIRRLVEARRPGLAVQLRTPVPLIIAPTSNPEGSNGKV